jgi:hypothetical protein
MAKKTAKKTVKKAPAVEGPRLYDAPSKEENDKAKAASEKVIADAKAKKEKKRKEIKGKVEKALKVGKTAIDMTMERVTSQLRHRLQSRAQEQYLDGLEGPALAQEVVRLVIGEMTKLTPEDLV